MLCVYCGEESRVVDSRPLPDGIRRRRECRVCGKRFTTHERLVSLDLRVVKARGRGAEEFQGEKIVNSLRKVCRGRNISFETMERIAKKIQAELIDRGAGAVRSRDVALLVMRELSQLDAIAFNRFAINYDDLDDLPEIGAVHREKLRTAQYNLFD